MQFSTQEYWSGLPFPFPRDFHNPGIEPGSPALQGNSLPLSHRRNPTGKIEVKVTQSCLTLCDPMDWSSPGQNTGVSSHSHLLGIFLTQGSNPGLLNCRQILLTAEPQRKPENIGVGHLSLLQGIFLIQELNWDLLHCRWALYQLSYQGSPQARLRVSSPCKEPSLQVQQGPRHQSVIVQNPKGMGNIHAFGGIGTTVENFISSVVFSDLERFCRPSPQGSQGSEFSWPSLRGNIPLLCIRAMF